MKMDTHLQQECVMKSVKEDEGSDDPITPYASESKDEYEIYDPDA